MTDAQPFPGASGRARALDPVHLEARLATAGWIRSRDGRWRHPESGITVALPGPGEPNLSFIAAATAAMAEGRELGTLHRQRRTRPHGPLRLRARRGPGPATARCPPWCRPPN